MNKDSMIIIDLDKEKIDKLKKRWEKVQKRGEVLEKLSTSGFIISVLSPFDFEGPFIEMLTAIIAVVGFFMKRKGRIELDKIYGRNTDTFDDDDKKTLQTASDNFEKILTRKKKK